MQSNRLLLGEQPLADGHRVVLDGRQRHALRAPRVRASRPFVPSPTLSLTTNKLVLLLIPVTTELPRWRGESCPSLRRSWATLFRFTTLPTAPISTAGELSAPPLPAPPRSLNGPGFSRCRCQHRRCPTCAPPLTDHAAPDISTRASATVRRTSWRWTSTVVSRFSWQTAS